MDTKDKTKYLYRNANRRDDSAIRDLLNRNPVPGSLSLVYSREPSFFNSLDIMGSENDVIVCDTEDGVLAGAGMSSYLTTYINGSLQKTGYLHSLRVDKNFIGRGLLYRAFETFRKVLSKRSEKFFTTTIIEDNHVARHILTTKGHPIPKYNDIGRYTTFVQFIKKRSKSVAIPQGYSISNAKYSMLNELVDFINSCGSNKQFYPHYTKKIISDFKDFDIEKDLFVCYFNGNIAGVVGRWDQSSLRQTTVHSYNGIWKLLKPLYNILTYVNSYRKLPEEKQEFKYLFTLFNAIKNDDPFVLKLLLDYIKSDEYSKSFHYLITGLHQEDPLYKACSKSSSIKYHSRMYIVTFNNESISHLSEKIPYLECARI